MASHFDSARSFRPAGPNPAPAGASAIVLATRAHRPAELAHAIESFGRADQHVGAAQRRLVVPEQRLVRVDRAARVIEDPRRVQIGDVDRRILAHQHDVEVREPHRGALADRERFGGRRRIAYGRWHRIDDRIVANQPQVLELTRPDVPATRGRLEHQAIRGIAREPETLEWVENEQRLHAATMPRGHRVE